MSFDRSRGGDGLLARGASALVVIDFQERYLPHLAAGDRALEATRRMVAGAARLGVPILVTEQYPEGLGPTAASIRAALPREARPIRKMSMSCLGEPAFAAVLAASGRAQIAVTGIEAHACVSQTVHQLLARGLSVHVVADAVTARFARDAEVAIARMARAGAVVTTVEAALLEWVRTAEDPAFREIQALIREALPG